MILSKFNIIFRNKEDRAPTRNKIQTAIADASGKEDLSNTRLEFRLKIKDLENLKQAFDVNTNAYFIFEKLNNIINNFILEFSNR